MHTLQLVIDSVHYSVRGGLQLLLARVLPGTVLQLGGTSHDGSFNEREAGVRGGIPDDGSLDEKKTGLREALSDGPPN